MLAAVAVAGSACDLLVGIDRLQFVDGAAPEDGSTSSDASDAADGEVADVVACPDAEPDPNWSPFAGESGVCSPADLSNAYTACGDPIACNASSCLAAFDAGCLKSCLLPGGGFGAVETIDNVPLPSLGSCVAHVTGGSCGAAAHAWQMCGRDECHPCTPLGVCQHPQMEDYVSCVYAAMNAADDASPCASSRETLVSCLGGNLNAAEAQCGLFETDEKVQYDAVTGVLCGP